MKKIVCLCIVLSFLLTACASPTNFPDSSSVEAPMTTAPVTTTAPPQTTTTPVTTTTSAPEPEVTTYSAGMYKVGADIPAGEYFIVCDASSSCYYSISSDSSGSFDSIISNGNISTFTFLTVLEGEYLTVKRGSFCLSSDIVPINEAIDCSEQYIEGTYRVGIDIPSGEYKISANSGESAYVAVLSDSRGGFDSIITNENFEGDMYITISDGQYIEIHRGYINAN